MFLQEKRQQKLGKMLQMSDDSDKECDINAEKLFWGTNRQPKKLEKTLKQAEKLSSVCKL